MNKQSPTTRISHHFSNVWLKQPYLRPFAVLVAAFALTFLLVGVLQPENTSAAENEDSTDLILVGLEPAAQAADLSTVFAAAGFQLVEMWPEYNLAAVRPLATAQTMVQSSAALLQSADTAPLIRYAEPNFRIEAAVIESEPWFAPNDPKYAEQWALPQIGMEDAWRLTHGSPAVTVAVIDSGVEITHEDLGEGIVWPNLIELDGQSGVDDDLNGYVDDIHGWDWVDDDAMPMDLFGHGTHVAGTVFATVGNNIGVAGMSPNVRLLPLRVLDERGSGFISDLVAALDYARSQGVQIVNLSLVLRFDSAALRDVLTRLYAEDVLVIAATGNYGNQVYWPAAYAETLAVAAVNAQDVRSSFSNYGPQTDVAAPGESVLSTYKNNGYFENSGTSMATPHVAALAALLWSLRPDLSRDQVIDLILKTANDVNSAENPGFDPYLGFGRINVAAALQQASAAVVLDLAVPEGSYFSVGQPLQLPVRVTVTNTDGVTMPVAGAVVSAAIISDTGGAAVDIATKRFYSDESGYVMETLTLPTTPGDYLLRVSHGAQEQIVPLHVEAFPLSLSLQPLATSIVAGSGPVDLVLEARTNTGERYSAPLSVSLHTTLGRFADGSQTRKILLNGGVFTETFDAGSVAGTADLSLEMSGQSQHATVLVTPAAPFRLEGPDRLLGLNFGDGATVEIKIKVYDQYGNQVWAPYPINFYSTGGQFSPESVRSTNGEATVQFTMGPWVQAPQSIWAMIPGTFAVYRVEAVLMSNHRYLPQVHNQ